MNGARAQTVRPDVTANGIRTFRARRKVHMKTTCASKHQRQIHVEQDRQCQDDPVRQPAPTAFTPRGGHEQHRQPHCRHHRHGVGASLDTRPRRPGQDPAEDAGAQSDGARRELLAQHDNSRRGASCGQTAGRARPELRGREDLEPAVHEQVVQAVHRVDVAQHLPQLIKGPAVGGRNRGGLVIPERRAGGAGQTYRGGQHSDDQRVKTPRHTAMVPFERMID